MRQTLGKNSDGTVALQHLEHGGKRRVVVDFATMGRCPMVVFPGHGDRAEPR